MGKEARTRKAAKVESPLETFIQTEDRHWNGFALRFLCKVKEEALFPEEELAITRYRGTLHLALEHYDQALKADHVIAEYLEDLTEAQRLAIYKGAMEYIGGSVFGPEEEEHDMKPVLALLKARSKHEEPVKWSSTAKDRLRNLVHSELDALPATLSQLEPKDRIAALCKLIPYVLPKGEEVNPSSFQTW
jgi:hypothetical protein